MTKRNCAFTAKRLSSLTPLTPALKYVSLSGLLAGFTSSVMWLLNSSKADTTCSVNAFSCAILVSSIKSLAPSLNMTALTAPRLSAVTPVKPSNSACSNTRAPVASAPCSKVVWTATTASASACNSVPSSSSTNVRSSNTLLSKLITFTVSPAAVRPVTPTSNKSAWVKVSREEPVPKSTIPSLSTPSAKIYSWLWTWTIADSSSCKSTAPTTTSLSAKMLFNANTSKTWSPVPDNTTS